MTACELDPPAVAHVEPRSLGLILGGGRLVGYAGCSAATRENCAAIRRDDLEHRLEQPALVGVRARNLLSVVQEQRDQPESRVGSPARARDPDDAVGAVEVERAQVAVGQCDRRLCALGRALPASVELVVLLPVRPLLCRHRVVDSSVFTPSGVGVDRVRAWLNGERHPERRREVHRLPGLLVGRLVVRLGCRLVCVR